MNKVRAPRILLNTSSWINIFEIGLHSYLIENFNINTTPKVVEEIKEGEGFAQDAGFNNRDFIILIDDSKVYRVLERIGIKYISSVNIVIDASITGNINKKQAFEMLDKLRISFSDEAIDKAKDVIINGNKNQSSG